MVFIYFYLFFYKRGYTSDFPSKPICMPSDHLDSPAGVTWNCLMLLCVFEASEYELAIDWHFMNRNKQGKLAKIHIFRTEKIDIWCFNMRVSK